MLLYCLTKNSIHAKILDPLGDAGTLEGYEDFLIIDHLLYNLEFLRLNSLLFFDLKKAKFLVEK